MALDHWIAFILLTFLGLRMIISFRNITNESHLPLQSHSIKVLVITALATSMDALAVGVSLAFLKINIITSLTIGIATTIMATSGILLSRIIGTILGKWSEMMGGLILISIGFIILLEHLHVTTLNTKLMRIFF